jgi:hypothetical protein
LGGNAVAEVAGYGNIKSIILHFDTQVGKKALIVIIASTFTLTQPGSFSGIDWQTAKHKTFLVPSGGFDFQDLYQPSHFLNVGTGNPGTVLGSRPRFSLFLSAMLTHGAIVAHHKK